MRELKLKITSMFFGILSVVTILVTTEMIVPDGATFGTPEMQRHLLMMTAIGIASGVPFLLAALWFKCEADVKIANRHKRKEK